MIDRYAGRTHDKMREVLLSPEARGPAVHYHMIRGGSEKTNITVWEPGIVGTEFIKSYGHYHVGDISETYTLLQGEGFVIIQTRKKTGSEYIDEEIESLRAIKVKAGDKVFIPAEAGHLVVNTSSTWLVTSDDSPVNFEEREAVSLPGHADYEPFKKLRGAAYYVVEKDGKPEFIKNSNYKSVPELKIEEA